MSKQRFVIKYKCPHCGKEGYYEPDSNDLKQLNEAGIASFSVFHGDHTLVVWFDKSGGVRAYDVFKASKEEEISAPSELNWKRISTQRIKLENISLLFADKNREIYSDLLFKGDPSIVLRLIESIKEPKFIKIDTTEYYVYPMDNNYIAIGGEIPTRMLDKIIGLFRSSLKYDVTKDEVIQYVIGAAIESAYIFNDTVILMNAIELLKHIDEYIFIEKKMLADLAEIGLSQIDNALLIELKEAENDVLREFIKKIMEKGNHAFFRLFLRHFGDLKFMNLVRFTLKP